MTLAGRWEGPNRFISETQPMVQCYGKFSLSTGRCLECGSQVTDHYRPLHLGDPVPLPCEGCEGCGQFVMLPSSRIAECSDCDGSGTVERKVAAELWERTDLLTGPDGEWVIELTETTKEKQ